MKDSIEIYRTGLLTYQYRTFGILHRARESNGYMTMPGVITTLGEGYSLTKWGANRKAKRNLKYNR